MSLPIIEVERDDEYADVDIAAQRGDTVLLSLPCPMRHAYRGTVGGQMITACPACDAVMPSTAGPHPADSRFYKPVTVWSAEPGRIYWTRFHPAPLIDGEALSGGG